MAAQATIELRGTLTIAELTRFQYFHTLRRAWPLALGLAFLVIVVVPLLVVAAIVNPASANPETDWRTVLTNALPFLFLLLFWVFLMGVMPYRNARKQFAAQGYLGEPTTYTFNAENLSASGPSISWSIAWRLLKHVRETRSLFVLYHGTNLAVVVPKRMFPGPAEMEEWRQLVSDCISPKKIQPPGLVARWC